ncbi:MAG TPA: Phenylacetic acid catabolic protein, partial [Bacteroidia bacterium]|nr:Phenylacetic acid catabolic protein [Bacteroidia bacterium]
QLMLPKWKQTVSEVISRATLTLPEQSWQQQGSRQAKHTEHLGFLLAEMQHLHRTYPQAQW